MKLKKQKNFEYGEGTMAAQLPDYTDVFIPGEPVKDPDPLPQDWDSLYKATMDSIRNPIGMPTITELAHKGSKVTIIQTSCQPTTAHHFTMEKCVNVHKSPTEKCEDVNEYSHEKCERCLL